MCHAWAHYVHVGCTSGHPLWQCSKQPIIYSTLISTHVNPHRSSRTRGRCCGSHTAGWQDTRTEREKTLLGSVWTCHDTRQAPLERAGTSSPFQNWSGGPTRKRSTGRKLIGYNSSLVPGTHLKQHASGSLKNTATTSRSQESVLRRLLNREFKETLKKDCQSY